MKIQLKENERIDDLGINNMKIIQNPEGFCFGMDSVLLSDFAKEIKDGCTCVDLGTGTGILGILLCAKTALSKMIGIEIQEEVADMAKRSILLNNLDNRFRICNFNIKDLLKESDREEIIQLKKEKFDYAVMNPPYKKLTTGKTNENEKKYISRHEATANLNDFIQTASKLLKDKGSLYMVHRPDRLVDVITELRKAKLEPKELKFVHPNANKAPNLILIKATKNAKPFLKVLPPLYIYQDNGKYTSEVLNIYNLVQ